MSFDQVMASLLAVYVVAVGLLLTLQTIGASRYELQLTRQRRQRLKHPYAKAYRNKPLITIIIMSHNQAQQLTACLDSLRRSSYRKFQILLIDNASTDNTKVLARQYGQNHPKLAMQITSSRQPTSQAALINSKKRLIKGDLAFIINAAGTVNKQALKQLVQASQDRPQSDVFVPNSLPNQPQTLRGLLKTYTAILSQPSRKLAHTKSTALACRRQTLNKLLKNQVPADNYYYVASSELYGDAHFEFGQQTTATDRTTQVNNLLITTSQIITKLLTPLLLSYFIYLALALHEPSFILLAIGGLSLLLVASIWEYRRLGFWQRLAYTLGIPVTYVWLFALAWLELFRTLRQTSALKQLASK